MDYRITTQKELRAEFWATFPGASRKRQEYAVIGKMYCTDTRCAWCDWIDSLQKGGEISEALASRATL